MLWYVHVNAIIPKSFYLIPERRYLNNEKRLNERYSITLEATRLEYQIMFFFSLMIMKIVLVFFIQSYEWLNNERTRNNITM